MDWQLLKQSDKDRIENYVMTSPFQNYRPHPADKWLWKWIDATRSSEFLPTGKVVLLIVATYLQTFVLLQNLPECYSRSINFDSHMFLTSVDEAYGPYLN